MLSPAFRPSSALPIGVSTEPALAASASNTIRRVSGTPLFFNVSVSGTVTVRGTLDGGMKTYCCIGDGSQSESQDPMFEIDSVPFLANSFDATEKLWKAAREG